MKKVKVKVKVDEENLILLLRENFSLYSAGWIFSPLESPLEEENEVATC
jgi:hypothetical protein